MNGPGNFPMAPPQARDGMFPPPPARFTTPRALRARAAVRLEMAQQDQAWGDTGARDRNLREARLLEILADARECELLTRDTGRAA